MSNRHVSNHTPFVNVFQGALFGFALSFLTAGAQAEVTPRRGLEEVNHNQVELRGGFWGPRLKTQHEVTIPHALNRLEADGHVTNFDKAAGVYAGPLRERGQPKVGFKWPTSAPEFRRRR